MKRIAWFVAVILATLTVVFLLWRFHLAVVLFGLSLLVAATLRPSIDQMVENRIPRGLAIALTYLFIIAVAGSLLFLATGPLIGELQEAGGTLGQMYAALHANPPDSGVLRLVLARLPKPDELSGLVTGPGGSAVLGHVLGLTLDLVDLISNALLVLVLSIYWGSDQARFERLWLSLLPAENRTRARNIWRSIEGGVGAYVRSELLQSMFAGVLLALGFAVLGVPDPVLLAVIGALAWLVPVLGGVLALVPVVAFGLLVSPWLALAAAVFTLAVFALLEFVVERRLFDHRRYSSILVVLVMIAMADVAGVIGLLVAPPLAAAVQIFFRELVTQPAPVMTAEEPAAADAQMEQLKQQLAKAQGLAADIDEPAPEVQNLLRRLADLVDRADRTVSEDRRRPHTGPLPGSPAPRPPARAGVNGGGNGT